MFQKIPSLRYNIVWLVRTNGSLNCRIQIDLIYVARSWTPKKIVGYDHIWNDLCLLPIAIAFCQSLIQRWTSAKHVSRANKTIDFTFVPVFVHAPFFFLSNLELTKVAFPTKVPFFLLKECPFWTNILLFFYKKKKNEPSSAYCSLVRYADEISGSM